MRTPVARRSSFSVLAALRNQDLKRHVPTVPTLVFGALAPFLTLHGAQAQTWVGTGSNASWDLATNWAGGILPISTTDATNTTAFTINHDTGADAAKSFTSNGAGEFDMTNGTLNVTNAFAINSVFTMNGGNLNVGSFTATGSGPVTLSGGTLNVSGNFTSGPGLTMNGGVLQNATVTDPTGLTFANNSNNVLENVTLAGGSGLTVSNGGLVRIADGLNYTSGATFNVGTTGGGYLLFDSTATTPNPVFDHATINLGSGGIIGFNRGSSSESSLTFGTGLTIQGQGSVGYNYGGVSGVQLINNGTINSNIASGGMGLNGAANANIVNNGTVEATASGSGISVTPASAAAFVNNGTVLATGGGAVSFNGTEVDNSGTLKVDASSLIVLGSTTATQTSGATIVLGALGIATATNTYTLSGGQLYGTGTIGGNLMNTGATIGAGMQGATPVTGTLTLSGNYTQGAAGVFSAALGGSAQGTGYDFFTVSGTAALDGDLDIDLINGFVPTTVGQTFQIIADGSTTGTFANMLAGNMIADDKNQYLFQVVYGTSGVSLTYQGADSTPEPGPANLLLLVGVPGAAWGFFRRRLTSARKA